ncbi:type I restriction-modification system subunit M N-terminal domain-containing protein, partial [Staphylococcus aureus]|uniref:type I restriction-modification system subunit M N-terminal domain-containing protein n=1 Tax=Staphylococcus aureus TaxID=1280 RepID=UPI00178C1F85
MSITEKQRQQQAELHKKLWSIANDLRGNMDASEFRNYILGLIFYRFLSEKEEQEYADALSGEESENDFIGLFSDMDLSSTRLGNNVKERTALISKVMVNLD